MSSHEARSVWLVNGCETLLKTITYLPDQSAYLFHAENPAYEDRIDRDVQIQGVAEMIIKSCDNPRQAF